jgi:hypothetical protein
MGNRGDERLELDGGFLRPSLTRLCFLHPISGAAFEGSECDGCSGEGEDKHPWKRI